MATERVLVISHRCHIRSDRGWLAIDPSDGDPTRIPLRDLACVVLETEQAVLTTAALADCCKSGIPVVICAVHKPIGMAMPFGLAWNTAEIQRLQATCLRGSAPGRRLWRRTVIAKIRVQGTLIPDPARHRLSALAKSLAGATPGASDHPETIEAQAAAIYWRELLSGFERRDESDPRNALLNWGYAVLVAAIARACVSIGLNPCLGFGHSDRANQWALCHDLMEPFRPSIDAVVAQVDRACRGGGDLAASIEDDVAVKLAKRQIVALLANGGEMKRSLMVVVNGYRRFLEDGNEARVPYPRAAFTA